jgi:HAD superfamily hydrolase (TIGR01509 family)
MPYELVIFDCDGVLVDSEPIVNRLFVATLAGLGHALDYEKTLREFSGTSTARRFEVCQRRLGMVVPPEVVGLFKKRLSEAMARELRPVSGVRAALERMDGPRCVASNGSPQDIRERLDIAGLLSYFEPYLFSATEVPRGKPHADVFLHAAQAMGIRPPRCAVVEDSITGVEAGVRAGMAVFGYATLSDPTILQAAGARVFFEMAKLPELLHSDGGM